MGGLAVQTGVWLTAKETEISTALSALLLGNDLTFTFTYW